MEKPPKPFEFSVYPECEAGQYSHRDCTVAFYTRVGSLLARDLTLLNLGAGRGANILADYSPFRRNIQTFSNRVERVIGVDVDDAIQENPDVHEAHVIDPTSPYPIEDNSVDVIVCDHVLEHVEAPKTFAAEVGRVLRPGGWFCARTPSKWGYIGIGARIIPSTLHTRFLKRLQPQRKPEDVFPTHYKLNTFGALKNAFPVNKWGHHSYGYNGVPSYHGNSLAMFRMIEAWCWLMPPRWSAKYHVFLRKRS